jgi:hypothetical protein
MDKDMVHHRIVPGDHLSDNAMDRIEHQPDIPIERQTGRTGRAAGRG